MNTRRFAACLCMLLLSILLIPAAASAKVAAGEAHRVPVGELLEAGDYVEGEALAVVREGAEVTFEAWGKDLKWNTSLFHLCYTYPVLFLCDWGMEKLFV